MANNIELGLVTSVALVAMHSTIQKFNKTGRGPLRQLQEGIRLLRAVGINWKKAWYSLKRAWFYEWRESYREAGLD